MLSTSIFCIIKYLIVVCDRFHILDRIDRTGQYGMKKYPVDFNLNLANWDFLKSIGNMGP